jgi:hypothetical protein
MLSRQERNACPHPLTRLTNVVTLRNRRTQKLYGWRGDCPVCGRWGVTVLLESVQDEKEGAL